jgi:hypothetical protein
MEGRMHRLERTALLVLAWLFQTGPLSRSNVADFLVEWRLAVLFILPILGVKDVPDLQCNPLMFFELR